MHPKPSAFNSSAPYQTTGEKYMKYYQVVVLMVLGAFLAACGGGGTQTTSGNPPPTSGTKSISGVVAAGAAIANATVTVTDANGVSANAVTTDVSGVYTVDVTNLTAPLFIKAVYNGGIVTTLYSYAGTGNTIANVNPLSNAVVLSAAKLAGVDVTALNAALVTGISSKESLAYDILTKVFAAAYANYGVTFSNNPITTAYTVGSALDNMFDVASFDVSNKTVSIMNKVTGNAVSTIPDITTATVNSIATVAAGEDYKPDTDPNMSIDSVAVATGSVGTHFTVFGKGFAADPGVEVILINGVKTANFGGSTTQSIISVVTPGCTTGTITYVNMTTKRYLVSNQKFTVAYDANTKYFIGDVAAGSSSCFISGGNYVAGSVVDVVQNGSTVTVTPLATNINPGAIQLNFPGSINANAPYTLRVRDTSGAVSNMFAMPKV